MFDRVRTRFGGRVKNIEVGVSGGDGGDGGRSFCLMDVLEGRALRGRDIRAGTGRV